MPDTPRNSGEPTPSLRQRLDALSPAKRALLEKRLREGRTTSPAQAIPRRPDTAPAPLSFAQERLWFLDRFEPGSLAYTLPHAYRLRGPLDVRALESSLVELVRRHEALRTTFRVCDGEPRQVIAPAAGFNLASVALEAGAPAEREAHALRWATAWFREPFDLSTGPLLRAALLRLDAADHLLLLNVHHIVFDGWSAGVLRRDLFTLYTAVRDGRPTSLPELPVQYADFAVWQRQHLQAKELGRHLAYWRERLAGSRPLELPTDRPRPARLTYSGARHDFTLSADLSDRVRAFSRREDATPFMCLLGVFHALLARHSGQQDVLVGTVAAGRCRLELEGLIGLFVNTLIVRGDLSGEPTFKELTARVRRTTLEAFQHQELPLEKLIEALNPPRDPSRPPLFSVLFALHNLPAQPVGLPGLSVSTVSLPTDTTRFDLELHFLETERGFEGSLFYNTDLYDAGTARRQAGHYRTLLEGLLAEPDRPVAAVPMLTDAERHQLQYGWGGREAEYPRHRCVHELFEAQARRSPEAVALASGDQSVMYRELNRRANRLASALRSHGVGPDVLVALCAERSPEMIVGLLAVLKAGGAYVPLDPSHPGERLAFILEDARASVLLTQSRLLDTLPTFRGRVVPLGDEAAPPGPEWDEFPSAGAPESLAYVIYTSGSTGQPKGVAVPHRAVVNLLAWQLREQPRPGRTLQMTTLTFDVSVLEIFGTLCAGGTLVLIPDAVRLDPRALAEFVDANKVERVYLSFSPLQHLAEVALARGSFPRGLREVVTLGERLMVTPALAAFFGRLPACRLYNQYGPTEAAVIVTSFPLAGGPKEWPALPPIGRPIANVRLPVLDAQLQPVPVGSPGSLYIGGDCLARGYLNRPELTAQRFIPDPFAPEAGARLYRTGDRARYLPDGNIEFLGREDFQVKLRGFRVEPGEVEAVLNGHPAVRESAVVAREEQPGDWRLVAFLVLRPGPQVTAADLREFAGRKLPDYMLPAAFVLRDTLPLTASGKVDRARLQREPVEAAAPEPSYVPPTNLLEFMLTRVWEELLDARPIGLRDNFFHLGGHSLLAARMTARIEELYGLRLPLGALFAGATIEQLCRVLREPRHSGPVPMLVKVQGGEARPPFFFLHGEVLEGGTYCIPMARHLGRDQPLYILHPHGLSGSLIPGSVEEMAAEFLRPVRAIQPAGPYFLGGFCNGATVALEMARQLCLGGNRVDLLALIAPSPLIRLAGPPRSDRPLPPYFTFQLGDRLGPRAGHLPLTTMPFDLGGLEGKERLRAVMRAYWSVLKAYALRPYPGRLVVIQPTEGGDGGEAAWQVLQNCADEAERFSMPGDHFTSRTTHIEGMAAVLRTCLDKAQQRVGRRVPRREPPGPESGVAAP